MFHLLEHASQKNKAIGELALTKTKNKDSYIVPSINFPVNLWNANHYHVHDGLYGIGMWATDYDFPIDKWELILPNVVVSSVVNGVDGVTVDGGGLIGDDGVEVPLQGTQIKLFYGCILSWSGTKICHGTAWIANKNKARENCIYSSHWCSSTKLHTLAVELAKGNKKKSVKL